MVITLGKGFTITTVHREDLKEWIPDPADRARIPDEWMQALAEKLGDTAVVSGYWDVCEEYSDEIIDEFMVCHCCGESPCTCEYTPEELLNQPEECKVCKYLDRCKHPKLETPQ